jgi:EAL domain-containing protein (putative c-di-GMP-specific phosphodiesterase class I)
VIAKGVETTPQLAFLRGQHCDQIQGYLFSPPLPVPALERLIRARTTLTTPDETVTPRHDGAPG